MFNHLLSRNNYLIKNLSVHTFIDSRLFNHTEFMYDIAVAKVVPSIAFSNRVTSVNLPTCSEFELGR